MSYKYHMQYATSLNRQYYEAIQDALDVVENGQTVQVLTGTHKGPDNRGLVWPNTENITLQGISSVDTILDAEQVTRHVLAMHPVVMNISDIGFVNGKVGGIGGSIYVAVSNNAFMLEMENVVLSGNSAVDGGAIGQDIDSYSKVSMDYVAVYGNSAAPNGDGAGFYYGTNSLTNSSVYANIASGFGSGGGFYYGTNTFISSNVYSNSAASSGGGFMFGTNTLTNTNIYGNSGSSYGGGFYDGTNTLTSSEVYGNSSSYGGGFFQGTNTLINVLVYNNSASSQGAVFNKGNNEIVNSTIVSNNGAIYYDDRESGGLNGELTAYNTIS